MSNSNNADLMVGSRLLSSLRVVDLKQELEKRGLSKSGSKKDLADRLRLHLQIEKHRDTGASADEEELPNYSVHDELADQNPFIRDYLASQAELFHSQKVVKKLVEEEAKRESEASADEGVDSPVKQPPVLEREDSPVVPETRRQSRRRADSQREEMTAEKLTTRSSRSRSPAAATAPPESESKENNVQLKEDKTEKEKPNVVVPPEKPPEEPVKTPEPEQSVIALEEPTKVVEEVKSSEENIKISPKAVKVSEEMIKAVKLPQPPSDDKADTELTKLPEPVQEAKISKIDEPEVAKEVEIVPAKEHVEMEVQANREEPKRSPSPVRPKSPVVEEKNEEKIGAETVEIADKRETDDGMEVDDDKQKAGPTDQRSRSSSPSLVGKATSPSPDREVAPSPSLEKEVTDAKEKDDDSGSSSEEDQISSGSRDRSRSKSRSWSKSRSRSRSKSVDNRDDSIGRGKDSAQEKKSGKEEKDVANLDASVDGKRIVSSPANEIRKGTSRSVSRSPQREKGHGEKRFEKEDECEKEEGNDEDSKTAPAKEQTKADERKAEKPSVSKSKYKSSQKQAYPDLPAEEALDYGEEEEDEERAETDKEFRWTRRSLRFKNKATATPPANKWNLEIDGRHLIVKSELLNKFYDDIKLVPLEQLKLEEKSLDSTESKVEMERKSSVSQEPEPYEPLPTRTVENIQPVVKRTVSIIPASKVPAEVSEVSDKNLTPPRNPPSDVLLITNLVRPFTLPQLKEMLQRTGNLQDIWVDKIKSKCIVKFDSQEEAFETRAALHGVRWPSSNPKSLHVDYTTQDNLDEHKAKESGESNNVVNEKPVTAQPVPVREWDMGKKAEPKSPGRSRKRSRSTSRDRERSKRSKRTPSPGRRRHSRSPVHERRSRGGEGKEPEPMGKALDELFRKTIAAPSIYWLPLTPEQIAEKEELRRKRMLERERRLAELSKMRPR